MRLHHIKALLIFSTLVMQLFTPPTIAIPYVTIIWLLTTEVKQAN
jgi:hypothetical protein